jgi:hypothetical protein
MTPWQQIAPRKLRGATPPLGESKRHLRNVTSLQERMTVIVTPALVPLCDNAGVETDAG